MIFDNEDIIFDGDTIICKEVRLSVPLLFTYFRERTQQMVVGEHVITGKICRIWEDTDFVHIGCLKEPKSEFKKKYIQLVKLKHHAGSKKDGQ